MVYAIRNSKGKFHDFGSWRKKLDTVTLCDTKLQAKMDLKNAKDVDETAEIIEVHLVVQETKVDSRKES